MYQRCVVYSVILLIVPFIGAQEPDRSPAPFKSVKEATGEAYLPDAVMKWGGGGPTCQSSDGKPQAWRPAGVVIFDSNVDTSGGSICTEPDEEMVVNTPGGDFVFWRGPLHRVVFKPKDWRSKVLEIIWSGQINVFSGFSPPSDRQYQTAFLECTVTQKGHTVPCCGTDWIPAIAQDLTEKGLSAWVTYHGYAEVKPGSDVTVELWLWSWPWEEFDGLVNTCGGTLTLKY